MYNTFTTNIYYTLLLLLQYVLCSTAAYTTAAYTTMFSAGNGHWEGFGHMTRMFAFGASYTATGFNWKTGIQPSPSNPLGNPDTYKGHTASNGPNFIMYMTTKYNASIVQTYDFAWGGAPVLGMAAQVGDYFVPNFVAGAKMDPGWTPSKTLFPIFVGINDLDHWNSATTTAAGIAAYRDNTFKLYASTLETLYQKGARNIVVYNVPPLDRAPEFRYVPVAKKAEVDDYNSRLKTTASTFSAKHHDAIIWHVDMNALFNDVLNDKNRFAQTKDYKVLDATCDAYAKNMMSLPSMTYKDKSCPYKVNEYFWLNGRHVTYPLHDLLAEVTRDALAPSH